ncbi:hypothetical protein M8C21_027661 [Ambrosia artemisiifolia]|uniref:Uncharacterized protein n=1 Tax=Ambrosia artemisiifolia TaxID=4212 RepID=A0AAD5GJE1_AMBAR|nr:hypothetical protein M8C21_027661 [Ambrosia artemisiifolia]
MSSATLMVRFHIFGYNSVGRSIDGAHKQVEHLEGIEEHGQYHQKKECFHWTICTYVTWYPHTDFHFPWPGAVDRRDARLALEPADRQYHTRAADHWPSNRTAQQTSHRLPLEPAAQQWTATNDPFDATVETIFNYRIVTGWGCNEWWGVGYEL